MTQRLFANLRVAFFIVGSALVLLAVAARVTPAAAVQSPQPAAQDKPDNSYCLGCHEKPGMTKALPSGQTLALTIDPEAFKHGVHNEENVACVDCHTNITTFPHPAFDASTV